MNFLFLCVSETLYEKIPILDCGDGPLEPYRIVCLCSAQTREQARWDAWKTDKSFDADIIDMPQFWTRKIGQTSKPRSIIEQEYDKEGNTFINEWGLINESVWESLDRKVFSRMD